MAFPSKINIPPSVVPRLLFGAHSVTSLAYEILWIKSISPRLGMTQSAFGVVLACFVGGLALGSLIVSWMKPKTNRQVRGLFVVCQVGIGLWAIFLPTLLNVMDGFYVGMAPVLETFSHHGWRAVVAVVVLLPPSILIGTAFPLLSDWIEHTSKIPGRRTAVLYRDGLLWSTVGAGLAPTVLLAFFGLKAAGLTLALVNFLVALAAAFRLSDAGRQGGDLVDAGENSGRSIEISRGGETSMWRLVSAAFVLGAVLFVVQIGASQFLWLTVNDTFYAHAILVAVVLFSMGLGALGHLWHARRYGVSLHVPAYLLLGFAFWIFIWLLAPYPLSKPYAFVMGLSWIPWPAFRFFLAHAALIGGVIAIPSFAAGWAFTALCEKSVFESRDARVSIGRLAGWNYLGSVLGALSATFILIPVFGLTQTLAGSALAACLTAGLLMWTKDSFRKQNSFWLAGGGVAVCIVLVALFGDVTFRNRAGPDDHRVLFHHEDGSGITEVFEDNLSGDRRLYTSRLRMEGSNSPREVALKNFQGALPVALHPNPERVLVIGLGTGISLAAHLRPEVKDLTCVEYSRGVIRAAAFFEEENQKVTAHPNVSIVKQDGRNFARLSQNSYDLIIQDLFFPYQTGTGFLYTLEHYKALHSRLAPSGLVAQWIALHQLDIQEVRSILHTFQSVFPDTTAWIQGRFLLLVGGAGEFEWPVLKASVESHPSLSMSSGPDIFHFFLAGGARLSKWAEGAALNTDDNLLVERRAPLLTDQLDTDGLGENNVALMMSLREDAMPVLKNVPSNDRQRIARVTEASGLFWAGVNEHKKGNFAGAINLVRQAARLNPVNFSIQDFQVQHLVDRAGDYLRRNSVEEADRTLEEAVRIASHHREALFLKAQVAYEKGRVDDSLRLYEHLLSVSPNYHQGRLRYGRTLLHLGRRELAAEQFAYVINRRPDFDLAAYLQSFAVE